MTLLPSFALPRPIYYPPVTGGLTFTGLPRPLLNVQPSLPTARGPFPVFPAAPLGTVSGPPRTVSGGGFWRGVAGAAAGGAVGAGLALLEPEAAAGALLYGAASGAGTYVAGRVYHNMMNPGPGPKYVFPVYDLHGRVENPAQLGLRGP
jgi:hypothetical protein